MRRAFAVVVASFLLCCGSAAMALGFGQVANATRLGQPLDFSVALKLDPGETLQPSCISADVMSGDARVPPVQVRTRLLRNGGASDAMVRITTTSRLREPVVTVALSLGCPPRLSHRFVSLLDPPSAAPRVAEAAKAASPVAAIASAPAAEPPPADDERQRQRDQLQVLQDRVEELRQGQQLLQQTLGTLQARLRAVEEVRHDPALYGLAVLVLLLLGVIAALLWRQARQRGEEAWLRDAQAVSALGARPSDLDRPTSVSPGYDEVTMTSMRVVPDSAYPPAATEPAQHPITEAPVSGTTVPAAARVRRELSAEELIDLEQQADFFIALGQEESAIDLLMGHVRSSGGTSPMPYLKLLEIYRRRGEAQAYERIRERFNRRFNGHAPEWANDPALSRPLEDYPEIVERLQRAWTVPARAIDLLESLLFRRDPAQAGFDLPAYEELLFLYALARDHVEQEANPGGVDLLLPLELGDAAPAITHVGGGSPRTARGVDLELDLGAPGTAP